MIINQLDIRGTELGVQRRIRDILDTDRTIAASRRAKTSDQRRIRPLRRELKGLTGTMQEEPSRSETMFETALKQLRGSGSY